MFERRIVTDGRVYRIEVRAKTDERLGGAPLKWDAYPKEYTSVEKARGDLEQMIADDARVWTPVEA